MVRGTLPYWLQECPECGYAAADLSKAEQKAMTRKVMQSDAWKKLMPRRRVRTQTKPKDHESHPMIKQTREILARSKGARLPKRFLRRALIEVALGDAIAAAHSTLRAAWVEDDNQSVEGAVSSRRAAAELFKNVLERDTLAPNDDVSTRLILIDVLRRTDQWKEALSICRDLGPRDLDGQFSAILRFQKRLIRSRDKGCYSVEEALEGRKDRRRQSEPP